MKRRTWLGLPALGLALPVWGVSAAAGGHVAYTPEAYRSAMESGEPLLLDFFAPW